MKISAAVVMSVDAKLTRQDETDIRAWASAEDQAFFRSLLNKHDCIVMGRGTYEAIRQNIAIGADRLRVVMTSRPENFDNDKVPGKLEFRNQTPGQFIETMQADGRHNILVVGGRQMIADFLSLNLLDSLYVTLEPYLFGSGKTLLPGSQTCSRKLRLIGCERLNNDGTLLLRYDVIRD